MINTDTKVCKSSKADIFSSDSSLSPSLSPGPPHCSRLKYLNSNWGDFHEILYKCPRRSKDESCWICTHVPVLSSANERLKFFSRNMAAVAHLGRAGPSNVQPAEVQEN